VVTQYSRNGRAVSESRGLPLRFSDDLLKCFKDHLAFPYEIHVGVCLHCKELEGLSRGLDMWPHVSGENFPNNLTFTYTCQVSDGAMQKDLYKMLHIFVTTKQMSMLRRKSHNLNFICNKIQVSCDTFTIWQCFSRCGP